MICGKEIRYAAPPLNGYYIVECNGEDGLIGSRITVQKDIVGPLEICELVVNSIPSGTK